MGYCVCEQQSTAGRCWLNVQNTFLAYTLQSIAISIAHCTEIRASLTGVIYMEIFVDK